MQFRLLRLRFRRQLRAGQQQASELSSSAGKNLERHFFKRYSRLLPVRRFIILWTLLLALLIVGVLLQNNALSGYYQQLRPVPGGTYREGNLGRFTNANPIYAVSGIDATVSRLVFAGLFTHDSKGKIIGDLAESYSSDENGITYTVKLKPGLTWHDGKPLTSADVAFTYQLIQNPDAQSPLLGNWRGITVSTPDPRTVVFKLPDPLASFPHSLNNGIVPKHLLEKVPVRELRTADFNVVRPVGAGPFRWRAIQVKGTDPLSAQEHIALTPFANYANGKPKLQEFILEVYASRDELIDAFKAGQLSGVAGLNEVTPDLQKKNVQVHSLLQRAATMAFFKTSSGVLADAGVRAALVRATDRDSIIKALGYPTHAVREPLLTGQLGYDPALKQVAFDKQAAEQGLQAAGWVAGQNGVRAKAGQLLAFTLYAADTPEYRRVAGQLQKQWQAVGADVKTRFQPAADFQTTLSFHGYDAVLYGISIGYDPDVFVYWDSSQADIRSSNRLNLSEYKNPAADTALEAGRTRLDPAIRTIKYKPFLQAWQQDNPAVGLYQPRFLYLIRGFVSGFSNQVITTDTDRFSNVQNWQIRQARVTNQ